MTKKKHSKSLKPSNNPDLDLFRADEDRFDFDDVPDEDNISEMMQLLPALASLAENTGLIDQFIDHEENAHKEEIATAKPAMRKKKLKKLFDALQKTTAFKPGDLVEWKPGLSNLYRPFNKELAVVIELLAEPIMTKDDDIFSEPCDMLIGIIDAELNTDREYFRCLYVNQKRFRLVASKE